MFAKAVRLAACLGCLMATGSATAQYGMPTTAPGYGYPMVSQPQTAAPTSDDALAARVEQLEAYLDALEQPVEILPARPTYGGAYASVDAVWMKPHLEGPVSFAFNDAGLVDTPVTQLADFEWDHEVTPRAEFGYEAATGVGVRGGYWLFDHASTLFSRPVIADAVTPNYAIFNVPGVRGLDGAPGDVFTTFHDLRMYTIDAELTRRLRLDSANILLAGGVRYSRVENQTVVVRRGGVVGGGRNGFAVLEHDVEAIGPTVALESIVATRWDWLRLYADGRGAVLFGQKGVRFAREANAAPPPDDFISQDNLDTYLGTFDLSIGLETSYGPLFGRVGWEGHYWLNSGDASDVDNDIMLEGWQIGGGVRI